MGPTKKGHVEPNKKWQRRRKTVLENKLFEKNGRLVFFRVPQWKTRKTRQEMDESGPEKPSKTR